MADENIIVYTDKTVVKVQGLDVKGLDTRALEKILMDDEKLLFYFFANRMQCYKHPFLFFLESMGFFYLLTRLLHIHCILR